MARISETKIPSLLLSHGMANPRAGWIPVRRESPVNTKWGCHEFVGIKGLSFKVIGKSTQQEDYDSIVKETTQQQLPNSTRQKSQGGKAKREEEGKPSSHALVFEA